MDALEELLNAHLPGWDPAVVERGRIVILRLLRAYKDGLGLGPATVRAYTEVAAAGAQTAGLSRPSLRCPAASAGCAGCPSADS
jgi:hypothetical protein